MAEPSPTKRLKRDWSNYRCKRCSEEFVTKSSMKVHDCGVWKPRKKDWNRVVAETEYVKTSDILTANGNTSPKPSGSVLRQCSFCEKTYDKFSNLKNHTVNHFKEQLFARLPAYEPYNCPLCKNVRNVRDKITLMRHYAFAHRIIYEYCTEEDINGKIL